MLNRSHYRPAFLVALLGLMMLGMAGCNNDFWYVPMLTKGAVLTRLSDIDPQSPTFQEPPCVSFAPNEVPAVMVYGYANSTATILITDGNGKVVHRDACPIGSDQSYYWRGYDDLAKGGYKLEVMVKTKTLLAQDFTVNK